MYGMIGLAAVLLWALVFETHLRCSVGLQQESDCDASRPPIPESGIFAGSLGNCVLGRRRPGLADSEDE